MKNITDIIKKYKWKILLIYAYVFFTQVLFLAEPYILGKAIDGVLVKEYKFILILLCIFLTENLLMYKRMVYDTKVYVQIYNEIVFDYLKRDDDSDASSKIARTELTNNFINFLENDLQYFIMALMSIVGSLYFIFLGSWLTGVVVACCLLPTVLIVRIYYKKIAQGMRVGHTHYEQKFGTMNAADEEKIETFFKRRKRLIVNQSTLQGKHWASLNSVKSIFLVAAVIIFSQNAGLSQGQAVSMYAYISQFLSSLMSVPIGVETFARIRDVLKRLK
jgi:ABC-type multidrug transport system fused ATPase/permease subunit